MLSFLWVSWPIGIPGKTIAFSATTFTKLALATEAYHSPTARQFRLHTACYGTSHILWKVFGVTQFEIPVEVPLHFTFKIHTNAPPAAGGAARRGGWKAFRQVPIHQKGSHTPSLHIKTALYLSTYQLHLHTISCVLCGSSYVLTKLNLIKSVLSVCEVGRARWNYLKGIRSLREKFKWIYLWAEECREASGSSPATRTR